MKKSVKLSPEQVIFLKQYKKDGKRSLREINRANVLLLLDKGKQALEIAEFLDVGRNTVSRTKSRLLSDGLEVALNEDQRPGQPKKYKQNQEAEVIVLACSDAPKGRSRWTLELLADTLRQKEDMGSITRESIRLILKKTNVSLG